MMAKRKPKEQKTDPAKKLSAVMRVSCPNCHKGIIVREWRKTIEPAMPAKYETNVEAEIDHQAELSFD